MDSYSPVPPQTNKQTNKQTKKKQTKQTKQTNKQKEKPTYAMGLRSVGGSESVTSRDPVEETSSLKHNTFH
jgi:hypothetical protein